MRIRVPFILLMTVLVGANAALADPPPWAGGGKGHAEKARGKGKGHAQAEERAERPSEPRSAYFSSDHRIVVRDFYDERHRGGKCPPGLAKKRNGCMPPGQARKWHIGRPLPPNVIYYDVAPALRVKLGTPPPGHRFVRVAADILMITVGTSMVVDAIEDLGRM